MDLSETNIRSRDKHIGIEMGKMSIKKHPKADV
jgi:hypothetical protein